MGYSLHLYLFKGYLGPRIKISKIIKISILGFCRNINGKFEKKKLLIRLKLIKIYKTIIKSFKNNNNKVIIYILKLFY